MPLTIDQLPDDMAALKALLVAKDAELTARTSELAAAKNGLVVTHLTIEKLKAQIAKFKREKFGSSSERVDRVLAQLELALEEAETAKAEAMAVQAQLPEPEAANVEAQAAEDERPEKKKRRQLPPEFPRRDVVHMPADVCKTCGGTELRKVSESVTEVLSYVPARFEVVRHIRPACSCRKCETMVQVPMPELPIPRGMVDASFLAHLVVAKFCDHIPLYRQAEIDARSGIDIDRSQRAEWLGHIAWLLAPLVELIAAHAMGARVVHADDTPMTRRSTCWRPARAKPRPAGSGSICATSARTPAPLRQPCSIATRPTARANTAAPSWPTSLVGCMPTATPASAASMRSPA